MWLGNNFLQVFHILIFLINYILLVESGRSATVTTVKPGTDDDNETGRIPIGVVFDQNTNLVQHGFKVAMVHHSYNKTPDRFLDFQVYVDVINTADVFKLSRLVCNQFARGVVTLLASVHPDSFDSLHSYANTFQMPFVIPAFPEKVMSPTSGLPDITLSILPDYHKAVLGTLKYYGWRNVIYLYDSDDGLLRLQQLFKALVPGKPPYIRIGNVQRITYAKDVITYLRQLEKVDRWTNKYVILDCSSSIAKDTIITHAHDVQLGRRNYHYLFSGLVFDDEWEKEVPEFATINITGFKLVDKSRKFVQEFYKFWKMDVMPANSVLMYDAAHTVIAAFQRILKYKPQLMENLMNKTNKQRFLSCKGEEAVPLKYGEEIADFMRKTQVEGLSGKIRFSSEGVRQDFYLTVVRNTPDGDTVKIATWYDDRGFRPLRRLDGLNASGSYDRQKIYRVLSIHEPPYFISSKPKMNVDFNTDIVYNGFCAELAELIAEKLEINIEFHVTNDGKYGDVNPSMVGGWDGLVGELVRRNAEMVVAPLSVTPERETVVDFSKAFLSFNRIAPKNRKEKISMFGFLKPLSKETWYLLAVSVAIVSIAMYIVSRFSPMEWRVVTVTDTAQLSDDSDAPPVTKASVINKFSFCNSIWYCICAVMQQGSEFAPRSISGRIVSMVWWFFVLIMVCSYTANMASQFTLAGIKPAQSHVHSRTASCPEDMEAKRKKEFTIDDEVHGREETLAGLYVKQPIDYVKPSSSCEMIVTATHAGIIDFAVAFPKGSKLRTGVNLALTAIKEEGELNRLIRKYFHNTDAAKPPVIEGGIELTLTDVAGLFYILILATVVGLFIALIEFCAYHRSDAARANISIRTALRAKSRLQVNEQQEPCNRNRRRRRRDQERPWNGSGTAPGSQADVSTGSATNIKRCCCDAPGSCLKELGRHSEEGRAAFTLHKLPAPLETSPIRAPMIPVRAVASRHVMTRKQSRKVTQQVKKSREAPEHGSRPYFTPANQDEQEETALQNSLTQA